jgi:hypothetical protein
MTNTIVRGNTQPNPNNINAAYPYLLLLHGTAAALGKTSYLPNITSVVRFQTISTTETIKISGSKDDSTYVDLLPVNEATGQPVTSVALATGSYRLPLKNFGQFRFFKFTKSGAVNDGVVAVSTTLSRPVAAAYL